MTKLKEEFIKPRDEVRLCSSHKHRPPDYLYVAPFTYKIYSCPHCNVETKIEGKSILCLK